jgi:LysM repeat protein
MKSRKLGTLFLSMLLVFTLLVAVGCGKDDEKKPDGTTDPKATAKPTDNGNNNGNGNGGSSKTNNSSTTNKTVKLLKRNGVEWKENKKINSKVGAKSYKVVWGDTLRLIAKTWHVNTRRLAQYNKLKNPDLIEVNQIIYNYAAKK